MINSKLALLILLLLMVGSAGCTRSDKTTANQSALTETNTPSTIRSADVVKAVAPHGEIVAGQSAEAKVNLTIQKGYHVNSNPPTYSYLKPTELEITPSEGVSVSFIIYPDPLTKKFAFAEKPLAVYEGETSLRVMLKADKSARKGERSLSAKLRIQACDEQVCYAPGTLEFALPLNVK
jgi:thiol:disulfide interchange protein DsbD